MMLTCSVCGKMYAYESKICKQCEDYAVRSGLVKNAVSLNNFLVSNNFSRFGKVEHHDLRIIRPLLYEWNCNVRNNIPKFKEKGLDFMSILEFPPESKMYLSPYFE
jgi:hypothetical protein